MLTVPPLRKPVLPGAWRAAAEAPTRWSCVLRLRQDGHEIRVRAERCAAGRLRATYPVGAHDVEVRILDDCPQHLLTQLLRTLTLSLWAADPSCRRTVYAAPAGDLDRIGAAEDAGFRHVVDVDLGQDELGLLVAEPEWVTGGDADHDRVPGT
ncbi:hypothetical protein RKE30_15400 [Streptomyces sp. Li-HN-5-11]|uniref:hypothetical protein n=1 Tax=Streptomyces sp. Li-HN-5-11 TaxID=3075432 RepID=UPI0028ABD140|nr:hypothetical protein [Streptomyces sp. Li-HN-5-11]WNM31694.1 hypothetical protein RKE30_15400 [Streptomyces sp. Li-HN-5-11]